MSSIKKTGNPPVHPIVRSPKPLPKSATRRRQPATIPWYFWAVLGAVVVLGVILVGTLLGTSGQSSANQPTGVTTDPSNLLSNGYGEGNPNAPVKLVEFGDFQCSACQVFYNTSYQQIKQAYIDTGKIYYYYKPFPLTTLHPKAMKSAELAFCTANGNASTFFAVHDLLYANQSDWVNGDENTLWPQYARQAGADPTAVMDCVAKGTTSAMISASMTQGNALRVSGTPTLYLNGHVLELASFDTLKQQIDAALPK